MRDVLQTRADTHAFASLCEELLGRGVTVRFRARGLSMQPNILDGDALLVGPLGARSARRGEIALTREKRGLRAHRIVASCEHSNMVLTRGDAGLDAGSSPGSVLGKVISIERGRRSSRASGLGARLRHSFRAQAHRGFMAARRRLHVPLTGILAILLLSLIAVSPASGQSLNVSIAASPTPNVAPMDTIAYTISLSNTSGSRVNGATVSMVLPNYPPNASLYTAYSSAVATPIRGAQSWACNFTAATETILCADGNRYANGDRTTFTFVVTVLATAPAGTNLAGTVTAQGTNFPAGARATANVTVKVPTLTVTNTPAPNPIAPGDTLTYTVGLSNASGVNAVANETVTMADPVSTTFVSAAATGGTGAWTCNNTGGVVTCTDTANYNNGSATNFSFVFQVNAGTANGTVIPSTVNAQAANTRSSGTANSNVTVQTPDISVTNTPNPTPQVTSGNNITYTQTITNNGGEEAVGASFSETTPANTTFVSATPPAGWSCPTLPPVRGTGTINCTANAGTVIAAGGTATLTVIVKVNPGAGVAGATISDTVTVSETGTDPNLSNNTATASVTVTAADLSMTQSAAPAVLAPAATITYTESVTNNGPDAATNVALYQQTPPNTAFSSITAPAGWTCTNPGVGGTGHVLCTNPSLAANATASPFTFVVTVNSGANAPAPGTTIQNYADVTSQTSDPVVSNNATQTSVLIEIAGDADLGITGGASPTPVFVNSTLIYTLRVTNYGLAASSGTTLTDTLPAGVTFVSASASQGTCSQASGTVSCPLGAVAFAPSSAITVTITVTTPATATTLTNAATVSSTGSTDPVASNNSVNIITVVQPLVCATPGKDGSPASPLSGIVNTYYPPAGGVAQVTAGSISVALGAASGAATPISPGDLLLFIQMQGATINTNPATINTGAYGDGVPGDPGSGSTSLANSGEYEFVTATSAVPTSGGTLTFIGTGPIVGANTVGGLLNTYTNVAASAAQGQQTFQVIRVPQYASATLSSSLAALSWNGAIGGVLALDASSQLTLGGTVSVDGQGFRGAGGRILGGGPGAGSDYVTLSTDPTNGSKAEGIAGTPTYIAPPLSTITPATTATATGQAYVEGYPDGSYARGAPGNAGGGATDANPPANNQNSGGGGGANGGTGGVGGFGWSSAGIVGGFGGVAFPGSTSALILGGGGGAGTTNNGSYRLPATETGGADCGANCTGIFSSGTAGGGIVIIRAGSVTGTGTITANGQTALEVENDGGGGGGAGGSILVFANSGGLGGLTVQANGGSGGITWPDRVPGAAFPGNRHGPGGGGGGGIALLTGAPAGLSLLGGDPGYSTLADDAYGATPGQMGVSNTGLTITQTPGTQSGAYCAGADLAVTNVASPTILVPPAAITYTQTISNNGPFDALNAVFSEAIPANTTFQSIVASGNDAAGWTCTTTGGLTCKNPDVPAGASGNTTFTVVVNVLAGVPSGTQIVDTDSITSGTSDPNLANNTATAIVLVAAAGTADLSLTQTASPNPVAAGGSITYTITVTNNGPAIATAVSYTEPILPSPGYATFASLACPAGWTCSTPSVGGTGTVTASIGALAPGATATFTLVLNLNAATPSGTIISETAGVSSSITDPNPENNSVTANVTVASPGQYDLRVTTSASPNPVLAGNNISYTQTLQNAGPANVSNVQFSGSVPANTTFVSLGIPAGWVCTAIPAAGGTGAISCCPGSGASCSGAPVNSGTLFGFPMVVNVNPTAAPGTIISNTISVLPVVNDVTPANNTATSTTVVASPTQADVSIVKTASPEPVDQGTNLTYTLQVTNNGPAVAQNVTVSDPLPTEVTFTSVSTTQGTCTQAAGTVSCTLGSLSVGSVVTITIDVTASTFSSTTYATNTATVRSTTGDPNPANNTSSVTSTIEAPTAVQLSEFRAEVEPGGGVLIEWHTKEELRNLGFHLYREDATGRHRLDPSLIAGSALVLRGGRPQHAAKTYQWLDPQGTAESAYWIEDVDLNGTRTMHGPAQPAPASLDSASVRPSVHVARATLLTDLNRVAAASARSMPAGAFAGIRANVLSHRIDWADAAHSGDAPTISNGTLNGLPAVKISVSHEGWYRITGAQLSAAGFGERDPRRLQLYAEGVEVPLRIEAASNSAPAAIEFYGTGIDTPFSATRVYWLVNGTGHGLRVTQQHVQGPLPPSVTSFSATALLEQRTTYFAALLNGEDKDNFFGAVITPAPVDQVLNATHTDAQSSIPVTLDVTLQGGTDQQAHAVSVSFNGAYLGEMDFANQANTTSTFPVPSSSLQQGANTITLAALNGENDISVVQSIALHYPHTYTADSDWLDATAPAQASVHVGGFANPQIDVFDVTDPAATIELTGPVTLDASGSYGISVAIPGLAGSQRSLIAFSADQIAPPDALAYHAPSNLAEAQAGASYVVIAHPDFAASVEPLVTLHRSAGETTEVVATDDIFDAFNFGERSPFAIRSFLQLASTQWTMKPQAVLLVGDASLDPRNYLGLGDLDFVPTRMIETQAFKTASDDWFTDFKGTGFGTIPIGRIPADTPAEAALAVAKIVAYESGSNAGSWQQTATFIADQNVGDNFSAAAQTAATLAPPSLNLVKILTDGEDPSIAQQQIVAAIDNGTGIVDYSGHGAEDQWSFNDVFDGGTVATLTNRDEQPVFLLMDCLNGFFEDVYSTSLAEDLLFAPNGGAAAVWASSGFTNEPPQATMNQALLSALAANPNQPLGQAILQAKSGITDPDVRRTWILFGDPDMRLAIPAAPKPAATMQSSTDQSGAAIPQSGAGQNGQSSHEPRLKTALTGHKTPPTLRPVP